MGIITCHSGESCRAPCDHGPEYQRSHWLCEHPDHRPVSRVDLERGQWSYVILADSWTQETNEPIEVYVDAVSSFTEAIRIAKRAASVHQQSYPYGPVRTVFEGKVRRGLAYGLLLANDHGPTATIIPTPRRRLS